VVDLWLALAIGVVGFVMRRFSIPLAPVLIAAILGPMAETQMRRALAVSEGDPTIFVSSPLTVVLYALLAIIVTVSVLQHARHARRERVEAAARRDAPVPAGRR
jgi:putative tricarboxylic transport membrane protein